MDVVFAMGSGHVGGPDGLMVMVRKGTHWLASDPLVVANPAVFSTDPRWGLCSTVPFPTDADLAPTPPAEPLAPARRRTGAAA